MKTAQRLAEEKVKQEASRLVLSYLGIIGHKWQEAYDCAIFHVDELLLFIDDDNPDLFWQNHYQKVREEILKLKNK